MGETKGARGRKRSSGYISWGGGVSDWARCV
jgi:hypothetical protein